MPLPVFYIAALDSGLDEIDLSEDSSKHIVQVLRMQTGERLELTDGKGCLLTAEIIADNKKKCRVSVMESTIQQAPEKNICIGISLIKNSGRFEWFLEKATELGVTRILPLVCERTEKQQFRYERMKSILLSAMLQSRQCWLPELHEPVLFCDFWSGTPAIYQQKFIAHCMEGEKGELTDLLNGDLSSKMMLIGPEGDFTIEEVDQAVRNHFLPVSMGKNRLRTETAGVVAASLLCLV